MNTKGGRVICPPSYSEWVAGPDWTQNLPGSWPCGSVRKSPGLPSVVDTKKPGFQLRLKSWFLHCPWWQEVLHFPVWITCSHLSAGVASSWAINTKQPFRKAVDLNMDLMAHTCSLLCPACSLRISQQALFLVFLWHFLTWQVNIFL